MKTDTIHTPELLVLIIEAEIENLLHATVGRLKQRSRAVVDLTEEEMKEMLAGRMSAEHDHLNALLEKE